MTSKELKAELESKIKDMSLTREDVKTYPNAIYEILMEMEGRKLKVAIESETEDKYLFSMTRKDGREMDTKKSADDFIANAKLAILESDPMPLMKSLADMGMDSVHINMFMKCLKDSFMLNEMELMSGKVIEKIKDVLLDEITTNNTSIN